MADDARDAEIAELRAKVEDLKATAERIDETMSRVDVDLARVKHDQRNLRSALLAVLDVMDRLDPPPKPAASKRGGG